MAQYRQQVDDLMGKGKYQQLRQYMSEALARQSQQLTPPKGLDLSRDDIADLRRKRIEEGNAFLRKLGTTPEALGALNQRFHQQTQKASRLPDERKDNQGRAVDVKDVPARIRKHKTNPWTIRSAPFDGWNLFVWVTQNGDNLNYVSQSGWEADYTDYQAGIIGSKINIYSFASSQTGDHDTANAHHYSSVGFWYQMDSAQANEADRRGGNVKVWIEAKALKTQRQVNSYRQWGWTANAWVDQNNYITLRATGDGDPDGPLLDIESKALISRMVLDSSGDANWNTWFPDPETISWTLHLSSKEFQANKWIWIQIGTESVMDIVTDDFMVDSTMDFKWSISSVQITSSGDAD
jgi:hypothetical protein